MSFDSLQIAVLSFKERTRIRKPSTSDFRLLQADIVALWFLSPCTIIMEFEVLVVEISRLVLKRRFLPFGLFKESLGNPFRSYQLDLWNH